MTNSNFGGSQSLSCRTPWDVVISPSRECHLILERKGRERICGKRFKPDYVITPLLPFIVNIMYIMYSHYYNNIKEWMELPCWGSVITPNWIWNQLSLPLSLPSHAPLWSNHEQMGLRDHSAIVLVKNEGISTTGIFTKLLCGSKDFERRWPRVEASMTFLMLLLPHVVLFFNFSWLVLTSFLFVSGGLFPITSNDTSVAGCHSNQQWHYCHEAHNYVYDFTHKTMRHMEVFVFPLLAMWLK